MAGWLKALVDSLIEKGLDTVMQTKAKRRIVETGLMVFCGLTGLGGLIFIAVGGYLSLSDLYSPWLSGLIIGGVILALSLVGALLLWLAMRGHTVPKRGRSRGSPSERTQVDNVAYLGEIIGAHLSRQGIRTIDVMLAALAAGIALSASPTVRTRLRRRRPVSPDDTSFRGRPDRRKTRR
jgi:hypothetical protein